jgi:pimeloyl-ACP methyl ester carboxylesterase
MSAIILQDEIVHYEVLGRGRPLVLLHGWVGSWRYWIPTMQSASVSYRTYALDLWGFGDSAKNPSFYSLDQQIGLLDQFLQEMGIAKIALVGHGLGAMLALLYATRFEGRVDRILAVSLPNRQDLLNLRLFSSSSSELVEWLLARSEVNGAVRMEIPKTDPQAIQLSLLSSQGINFEEITNDLTIPCLIVSGQSDPLASRLSQEKLAGLPAHVHQIVFEQSGHFPMLDESNKFHRLMADFLALNSNESPRQLQLKEEWKRRVR